MNRCIVEKAIAGVVDYGQVMSCLQYYKAPHRKITEMLKQEDLIRVKKGLYFLGSTHYMGTVSRELLANLIFGPSYVSQEFALAYYGLIPERVERVTSMTTKRKKEFITPIGTFQYNHLNVARFTVGVDPVKIRENITILIGSPEKALADIIAKHKTITTSHDLLTMLIDDMRIDAHSLRELNLARLEKIAQVYKKPAVSLLSSTLQGKF